MLDFLSREQIGRLGQPRTELDLSARHLLLAMR